MPITDNHQQNKSCDESWPDMQLLMVRVFIMQKEASIHAKAKYMNMHSRPYCVLVSRVYFVCLDV